jgi:hypothetical protein
MAPATPGEVRDDRAARNEALFRRVNERLEMTLSEHEALRGVPTHFIVKPRHVLPEQERGVEQPAEYVVVEKFGRAGERARQLDPRSG